MIKRKKQPKIKEIACLNCGHPFTGNEVFCPNCGQKANNKKITFSTFIREVFASFFSWDAKFWRTIFPLLFKPGKVSKDYIEGKRARYTNPFRFYITMSILFFLVVGILKTHKKYKELNETKVAVKKENSEKDIRDAIFTELEKAQKKTDSLQQLIKNDSITRVQDSIALNKELKSFKLTFADNDNINSFIKFQREHPRMSTDEALEKLNFEKSFSNRFWYSRAGVINSFFDKNGEQEKFNDHLISYISIALLILLPILALFLKLLYVRRGYTYVEHLVFTFHIQTVCFIILTALLFVRFFTTFKTVSILQTFSISFLIYLFIAMKRFYKQKWFKTLVKFFTINFIFSILMVFTIIIISIVGLAMY
ncbi:DUF3667 domain-containing protein [Tenacibaculum sp. M341]|uniref:DUF3667 domain-containing protein n=1 Tax=Tenacibaculum sp. M341 TaxID=2530339 RepID=UPI001050F681|nr:DUF3667 domain-containing protein [Tenacibaculum sp. M341]TCI94315.1 DUF3667 domain-containing protein [Tenacibaculum sp. M341]